MFVVITIENPVIILQMVYCIDKCLRHQAMAGLNQFIEVEHSSFIELAVIGYDWR